MKNLIKLMLAAMVVLSSCGDPVEDGIYDGPNQVAWARGHQLNSGTYLEEPGTGDNDQQLFELQLIGRANNNPISVTYEINTDASTAIEGVHFNLVSGKTVNIPAGAYSTFVEIEVISDNFSIDENFTLVLDLVSADIKIAGNLNSLSHNMRIACESNLAGSYTVVSQLGGAGADICGDGADYGPRTDVDGGTVTLIGTTNIGQYDVASNACFAAMEEYYSGACGYSGLAGSESATVTDVCGDISATILSAYNTFGIIGAPISASGSVDGSGVITLTWTDHFGSANTSVLTPVP